jgi:hypothetical protein
VHIVQNFPFIDTESIQPRESDGICRVDKWMNPHHVALDQGHVDFADSTEIPK